MDALEELKQMHVEAKAAFEKIEGAGPSERGGLWAKLQPELELHEQIEERFVYDPVAREAGTKDPVLARWGQEHEAQVREADAVMAKIDRLEPQDAGWLESVSALRTTLEGHIAHEEHDIWPRIRTAWGEAKLDDAGRSVAAAKAAAKSGSSVSAAVKKGEEAHRASDRHE
jgi:iron-sulfur cluster repair protein YtfE (RIC family)